MTDYIFFMHDDGGVVAEDAWGPYLEGLRSRGQFGGGSRIGGGVCVTKRAAAAKITRHLAGYITVQANSLDEAQELLSGNPVFEAGGTVEIRELPRDA